MGPKLWTQAEGTPATARHVWMDECRPAGLRPRLREPRDGAHVVCTRYIGADVGDRRAIASLASRARNLGSRRGYCGGDFRFITDRLLMSHGWEPDSDHARVLVVGTPRDRVFQNFARQ